MSHHAVDLCVLFVEDLYGDLASRVFEVLAVNGRLSIPAILPLSSLTSKQVKHGLAVLIQQHLIFWYTPPEDNESYYEANCKSAYEIIRYGKYTQFVEENCGDFDCQIFEDILVSGHAEVGHLVQSYKFKQHGPNQSHPDVENSVTGGSVESSRPTLEIFNSTLCRLFIAGFVSTINESHFRSEADNRAEAIRELKALAEFRDDLRGELRLKFGRILNDKLLSWRLDTALREKLLQGLHSFGKGGSNHALDDNIVLRAQFDKFTVIVRNKKLVDLAEECIGKVASRVYNELLRRVAEDIRCCNLNTESSWDPDEEPSPESHPGASTTELIMGLRNHTDFKDSFEAVEFDQTNSPLRSSLLKRPREATGENAIVEGKEQVKLSSKRPLISTDDHNQNSGMRKRTLTERKVEEHFNSREESKPEDHTANNDSKSAKALKFEDDDDTSDIVMKSGDEDLHSKDSGSSLQAEIIRQHLLLLADHPYQLVHHIRRSPSSPERWTVNFAALSRQLQKQQLEDIIKVRYEKEGLRIVRILLEKGKLEEKSIADFGLMELNDARNTMQQMHKAGHLELQEIPRDNQRQVSKTIYLWHYNQDRVKWKVLEETYQTMVRFMQRMKVEKERAKIVIEKSERSDVKGREDELLTLEERMELEQWQKKEEKIQVQLGRLDDLVSILRDF